MPSKAATPKTKMLHLDASRRVPATKKGLSDRLIVQTACGKGRGAVSTTDKAMVTCPECRATLPQVEPPPVDSVPAPAGVPKRYAGKPAKPCKDCGTTIYGKTVERCVPCWKIVVAAKKTGRSAPVPALTPPG